MPPAQLKETTMNPDSRRLLKVELPQRDSVGADLRRNTDQLVNTLMGKKAELRFGYIRDHAEDALANLDVYPISTFNCNLEIVIQPHRPCQTRPATHQ